MKRETIQRVAGMAWASILAWVAPSAWAHVHGAAQLDIAIEGQQIELSLQGAGDGFVGFEHAPATSAQEAAVAAARRRLSALGMLLRIEDGGCRSEQVKVMSPESAHDEHDGHDGHDGTAHADWRIEARYVCTQPVRGLRLDASGLFQAFTGLHEIQVQAIGPAQQSGGRLTPQASVFTLP